VALAIIGEIIATPSDAGEQAVGRAAAERSYLVSVPGQKRDRILHSEKPISQPFRSVTQRWPESILFGHAGFSIP
jgi:hypothetical protein